MRCIRLVPSAVFPLTCYLHADRAQMAPKKKTGGNLAKARGAKQPKPRPGIALDGSTLTDDNVIQLAVPEALPSAAAPPLSGASYRLQPYRPLRHRLRP